MALFRGPGTLNLSVADGDAVDENFGPFDIGPCCDGGGYRGASLFKGMLKVTFNFGGGGIEL